MRAGRGGPAAGESLGRQRRRGGSARGDALRPSGADGDRSVLRRRRHGRGTGQSSRIADPAGASGLRGSPQAFARQDGSVGRSSAGRPSAGELSAQGVAGAGSDAPAAALGAASRAASQTPSGREAADSRTLAGEPHSLPRSAAVEEGLAGMAGARSASLPERPLDHGRSSGGTGGAGQADRGHRSASQSRRLSTILSSRSS